MGIQFNSRAYDIFGSFQIEDIAPDKGYPIWKKRDSFGRDYYGVANFCGLGEPKKEDEDLSWLEWEGNEVFISDNGNGNPELLFKHSIGIIKDWIKQIQENYPDDRFAIIASFDDGSALIEECEVQQSFTLRLWKIRDGQGPDIKADYDQPVISWNN